MDENYAKCRCQHCDGRIEFAISQLENGSPRLAACPHCKAETIIYIPVTKASPPKTEILPPAPPERDMAAEIRLMARRHIVPARPVSGDIVCPNPNCCYVGPGLSEGHGTASLGLIGLGLFCFWPLLLLGIGWGLAKNSKRSCPRCGTSADQVP